MTKTIGGKLDRADKKGYFGSMSSPYPRQGDKMEAWSFYFVPYVMVAFVLIIIIGAIAEHFGWIKMKQNGRE
jgi:hypothetical protein